MNSAAIIEKVFFSSQLYPGTVQQKSVGTGLEATKAHRVN